MTTKFFGSGRARAVGLILAGMAFGGMLISPAGAHFLNKMPHLRAHLDATFLTELEGDNKYLGKNAKAADADKLDGLDSTAFVQGTAGKAADSDLLDGINSTGFLLVAGKAADANLLDNLDSTAFQKPGDSLSGIFSCPGAGFYPEGGGTAYATDGTTGRRGAAADTYRCAADLPNGATVNGVSFRVAAPVLADVTACSLTRTALTGTPAETFVAGPTNASATGDSTITATLVTGNTGISNSSFGYSLECTLTGAALGGIYGAIVTYTVPASAG